MDKSEMTRFLWPTLYVQTNVASAEEEDKLQ